MSTASPSASPSAGAAPSASGSPEPPSEEEGPGGVGAGSSGSRLRRRRDGRRDGRDGVGRRRGGRGGRGLRRSPAAGWRGDLGGTSGDLPVAGRRGLLLEDGEQRLALHTLLLFQLVQLLPQHVLVPLAEPATPAGGHPHARGPPPADLLTPFRSERGPGAWGSSSTASPCQARAVEGGGGEGRLGPGLGLKATDPAGRTESLNGGFGGLVRLTSHRAGLKGTRDAGAARRINLETRPQLAAHTAVFTQRGQTR